MRAGRKRRKKTSESYVGRNFPNLCTYVFAKKNVFTGFNVPRKWHALMYTCYALIKVNSMKMFFRRSEHLSFFSSFFLFFSLLLLEKIRSSFIMLRIKETNSFRLLANREFWITSGFELHSFFFYFLSFTYLASELRFGFASFAYHASGLQVLRILRLSCNFCVSSLSETSTWQPKLSFSSVFYVWVASGF